VITCKTCSLVCHNAQEVEATFVSFKISLLPSVINIYHEINQLQALKSSMIQTFSDPLISAKPTEQVNAFLSEDQNLRFSIIPSVTWCVYHKCHIFQYYKIPLLPVETVGIWSTGIRRIWIAFARSHAGEVHLCHPHITHSPVTFDFHIHRWFLKVK
jgi:hypothetical protein